MPSPIVAATVQAAALSTASNFFAQFIEAYQENVSLEMLLLLLLRGPWSFYLAPLVRDTKMKKRKRTMSRIVGSHHDLHLIVTYPT